MAKLLFKWDSYPVLEMLNFLETMKIKQKDLTVAHGLNIIHLVHLRKVTCFGSHFHYVSVYHVSVITLENRILETVSSLGEFYLHLFFN